MELLIAIQLEMEKLPMPCGLLIQDRFMLLPITKVRSFASNLTQITSDIHRLRRLLRIKFLVNGESVAAKQLVTEQMCQSIQEKTNGYLTLPGSEN